MSHFLLVYDSEGCYWCYICSFAEPALLRTTRCTTTQQYMWHYATKGTQGLIATFRQAWNWITYRIPSESWPTWIHTQMRTRQRDSTCETKARESVGDRFRCSSCHSNNVSLCVKQLLINKAWAVGWTVQQHVRNVIWTALMYVLGRWVCVTIKETLHV